MLNLVRFKIKLYRYDILNLYINIIDYTKKKKIIYINFMLFGFLTVIKMKSNYQNNLNLNFNKNQSRL